MNHRLSYLSATKLWRRMGCRGFSGILFWVLIAAMNGPVADAASVAPASCALRAADDCLVAFQPSAASTGRLRYYSSMVAEAAGTGGPTPSAALIAIHGFPHDANRTFDAALKAVNGGGRLGDTLVVAPLFQVSAEQAARCRTAGVPAASPDDLVWSCQSWMQGGRADNDPALGSFAAMDALVAELVARWLSLRVVTIAGFSAGAQMVQHYIGFAAPAARVSVRYVVADPGTWLYFDPQRPQPTKGDAPVDWSACAVEVAGAGAGGGAGAGAGAGDGASAADASDGVRGALGDCSLRMATPASACPSVNRWKYGTDGLPTGLGRDATQARAAYAQADIHYLLGGLDTGSGKGTAFRVLDKSCGANAQGPYRLQRGIAYAFYHRQQLSSATWRAPVIVPGCAHDVACVFPSKAARPALLGP